MAQRLLDERSDVSLGGSRDSGRIRDESESLKEGCRVEDWEMSMRSDDVVRVLSEDCVIVMAP